MTMSLSQTVAAIAESSAPPEPVAADTCNPYPGGRIPTDELAIAMRQARALAARFHHLADSYDDLVAEAMLACLETARRYDPNHGAAMNTWMWPRMKGQMCDVVRRTARYRERFEHRPSAADEPAADPDHVEHPLDRRIEARMLLHRAAAELHTTDRIVLQGHYVEGRAIADVARLNMRSRSAVARQHESLLRRLRRHAAPDEIN